jgi:hypothetical protein
MKEDELSKIILDLKADNVRQQRELFKHMALLSSAIIGIFAFSNNQNISLLSKIGIFGLFLVIGISIVLLFFTLNTDRQRMDDAQKLVDEVKDIKNQVFIKSLLGLFTKENADLIKQLFRLDGSDDSAINKLVIIGSNFWKNFSSGDTRIEKKKKESTANVKGEWKDKVFNAIALCGIILFVLSLGFILSSILL